MEILFNPTNEPQTVSLEIFGNLGAGANSTILSEQGGFLITGDSNNDTSTNSRPVLLHYFAQVANPLLPTPTLSSGQLSWTFNNLTLAPQQRVRLLTFIAQTADLGAANQMANFIFNNSTALYEGLNATQAEQILNFTVTQPTPSGDFVEVPFISTDEIRQGSLSNDDPLAHQRAITPADAYAISLTAGETVTLAMAATFNAYLYVFSDTAGTQVVAANDDANLHTRNAEIVFTAPDTQTYYIEATAYDRDERGIYSLAVSSGRTNRPPLAYNFEFPPDKVPLAEANITFQDFSVDPDGAIVERCWQFGDGSAEVCGAASSVTHRYTQAGLFQVGLRLRDNAGAYAYRSEQIAISSVPAGTELAVATLEDELATSDDRSQTRSRAYADRYVINAVTPGQPLIIDMASEAFDSYLYLYDEFNQLLRQDDNGRGGNQARLSYTPTTTGSLWIEATSFQDNVTGAYRLSLQTGAPSELEPIQLSVIPALDNPLQVRLLARLPDNIEADFVQWLFGDNTPLAATDEPVVVHSYPHSGDYDVTLVVTDMNGDTFNLTETITVNNTLTTPMTRFQVNPLFGQAPLRTFFNNDSSLQDGTTEGLRYIWRFGDGEISTEPNPAHTFANEGTYQVVLQALAEEDGQRNAFSVPITVIDRDTPQIPVTGVVRNRPQVLVGGLDPVLVDLLDTDFKIFAVVRPGSAPVQTVRLIRNEDPTFSLVMQHTATYANGDQHYEVVYTFAKGTFPAVSFDELFGSRPGQFRIEARTQALDQDAQFHQFPSLEIGTRQPATTQPTTLAIPPLRQPGVKRALPQVLAAGFNPALLDISDTEITVSAIVRSGLHPIRHVTLVQNGTPTFRLPLQLQATLPNGDGWYSTVYTYPRDIFVDNTTLSDLFGTAEGQFQVMVEDRAGQQHSFPQFKLGNYPAL